MWSVSVPFGATRTRDGSSPNSSANDAEGTTCQVNVSRLAVIPAS